MVGRFGFSLGSANEELSKRGSSPGWWAGWSFTVGHDGAGLAGLLPVPTRRVPWFVPLKNAHKSNPHCKLS